MIRRLLQTAAVAALSALAGCGGGSSVGPIALAGATAGLSYVDPAQAAGQFTLVRDAASTPAILVLDLLAPSGIPAVGVTFGFDVDTTRAVWSSSPAVVTNGVVFTPATGNQLVQGWVNGGRLQAIVSNKGLAAQVADLGGVIGQIRLNPVAGAPKGTVTLVDNGLATLLDVSGTPQAVRVLVGTLTLN